MEPLHPKPKSRPLWVRIGLVFQIRQFSEVDLVDRYFLEKVPFGVP